MQSTELLKVLNQSPFVLAPMAAITDAAFRSFMKEMGCSIVVSELVSAKGLHYASPKTLKLIEFEPSQSPVGIQLFGEDPESLAEACKFIEQKGADFIDLNLGCPVPKVVKKGAGSALLKDLVSLRKMVRAMVEASQLPVTLKLRTGWDAHSRNADQVAQLAFDEGATWIAIHGRTRAQGYEGLADWDYIKEVKAQSKVPVIGNGDILNATTAVSRLRESGCDAVMIGRGCLKNPWIFKETMQLFQLNVSESPHQIERNLITCIERLKYWYERFDSDERLTSIQVRRFAAWFSAGYPASAQFRKSLFQTNSLEETMTVIYEYFEPLRAAIQADTSDERFLMGGHG